MTTSVESTTLQTAVVSRRYPNNLRPEVTRNQEFWESSNKDERTFFILPMPGRMPLLVIHTNDPRGAGMRLASSSAGEREAVERAGLDPTTHRVWTIDEQYLTYVEADQDKPQVATIALNPGEPVQAEVLRTAPGILFRRMGRTDALWVTHGDGTATQIEGSAAPGESRMGVGKRHETYVPDNSWVDDGWTFEAVDVSRIPGGPEMNGDRPATEEDFAGMRRELADAHAVVSRMEAEIASLKEANERQRTQWSEARRQHEADITLIGDALIDEAESRDWCSDYDDIVENLNRRLNVELRRRVNEYEVTVDITVRVTKTVEATTEDEAYDLAVENIDDDDLTEGDRHNTDHVRTERA